jgi:hypothetical protein
MNTLYRIASIVDRRTGEPTERDARRKGHLIEVIWLRLGEPMLIKYVDEGSILTTSGVWRYGTVNDEHLVVTTKNSIYTFKSEGTK